MKVLGISGSLRKGAHSTQLLESARRALPADAELEIYDGLRDLPFYDEDIDTPRLAGDAVERLRREVGEADALLFVTPEYNATIPGGLKNLVDWISRPKAEAALKGKPVAVISSSTGQYGGVWALADLKRSLGIAQARVIDSEFAVSLVHEVIEVHGDALEREREAELAETLERLVEEGRINRSFAEQRAAAAA
jgi:chromate reductase